MAGVAAERLRKADPGLDDGVIADYIQEVRQKLETASSENLGR
jgi:hypothetical protein